MSDCYSPEYTKCPSCGGNPNRLVPRCEACERLNLDKDGDIQQLDLASLVSLHKMMMSTRKGVERCVTRRDSQT